MKNEELNSKKLRSILNTLRESCIYQNDLTIDCGNTSVKVKAIELSEVSLRNLEEEKFFLAQCSDELPEEVNLLIVENAKTFSIPLKVAQRDGKQIKFKFAITKAVTKNRRHSDREKPTETYFVPGQLRLKESNTYSTAVFVRLIDFDSRGISYELNIPVAIEQTALIGATIRSFEEVFVDRGDSIEINSIRQYQIEKKFGTEITKVVAISIIPHSASENRKTSSVIQPKTPFSLEIRPLTKANINRAEFRVETIHTDGFSGVLDSAPNLKFPKYFLAEHPSSRNRLAVYNDGQKFHFSLLSKDIGHRTQWYCYLSQRALGVQTKFAPEDSRAITRLMLESGNYKPLTIAKIAQLQNYLEAMWPIEDGVARTKLRWLVRDEVGEIIGHTAGLRVSCKLWAAIDNVGSQSYTGRWNTEYVAKWIRAFAEILNTKGNENLIQWTYSPAAGVWSEFERKLNDHKDLVYCRNTFSDFFPDNLPTKLQKKSGQFSTDLIEEKAVKLYTSKNVFLDSASLLLSSLFVSSSGSTFLNDFLLDYGTEHIRHYKVIKKNGEPKLLLSYSNYPFWASLNKGHDWIYIFEFKGQGIQADEELEILAIIRESVTNDGCDPFRLALVDSEFCFTGGARFTNLLIRPNALELAAVSTEKSK